MICECCKANLGISKKELSIVININHLVIKCPNCDGMTPIKIDSEGFISESDTIEFEKEIKFKPSIVSFYGCDVP